MLGTRARWSFAILARASVDSVRRREATASGRQEACLLHPQRVPSSSRSSAIVIIRRGAVHRADREVEFESDQSILAWLLPRRHKPDTLCHDTAVACLGQTITSNVSAPLGPSRKH